jgi:pimeloyl-ACP methyl ester carboxylesterase
MNLRPEVSPIDGVLHAENVQILQGCSAATTMAGLRQRCPGLFRDDDLYDVVNSSSLLPKTTIIRNQSQRAILYVLNGMVNYDKVQACLDGWDNPNIGGNGLTYPYETAARDLLYTTYVPGGNPSWLSVRIIGHSYGGAVAPYLASRLSYVRQETDMKIYTYGAPKPSTNLHWRGAITNNTRRVFLIGDPVPLLPLNYQDMASLWALVGVPLARRWSEWNQLCTGLTVTDQAQMVVSEYPRRDDSPFRFSTLAAWLTGVRAFGADTHSLDAYYRAMAVVPAVTQYNPAPTTERIRGQSAYVTTQEIERTRVIQQIQMGNETAADPIAAVASIQQNVVLLKGVKYHGARWGGVHAIYYNDDIVGVTRTLRLRRAIVRRLNMGLKAL